MDDYDLLASEIQERGRKGSKMLLYLLQETLERTCQTPSYYRSQTQQMIQP